MYNMTSPLWEPMDTVELGWFTVMAPACDTFPAAVYTDREPFVSDPTFTAGSKMSPPLTAVNKISSPVTLAPVVLSRFPVSTSKSAFPAAVTFPCRLIPVCAPSLMFPPDVTSPTVRPFAVSSVTFPLSAVADTTPPKSLALFARTMPLAPSAVRLISGAEAVQEPPIWLMSLDA